MKVLHLILLGLTLIFAACSQKNQGQEARVIISFGAVTGVTFAGGAMVQLKNVASGESRLLELEFPYNTDLPFGDWQISFVGVKGDNWQGPYLCGGLSRYAFIAEGQTVKINVTEVACEKDPYRKMIRSKGPAPYITLWKTDNPGISGPNQIRLPLVMDGTYDFIVDWGDGSQDHITSLDQASALWRERNGEDEPTPG